MNLEPLFTFFVSVYMNFDKARTLHETEIKAVHAYCANFKEYLLHFVVYIMLDYELQQAWIYGTYM